MHKTRLAWICAFFPPLRKFWLSRAGTLSGGQKQMLSFARAFIEERKLLLIDEPTKGLAPAIIGALIDCLAEVKRRGATILLVEQNFRVAQAIGDLVGLMDVLNFGHGAFIAIGAYVATLVLLPLGGWMQADSIWLNLAAVVPAIVLAMGAAALIGLAFERILIVPVYGQHLKQILITMG